MKRQHTIRPDFAIANHREINSDPYSASGAGKIPKVQGESATNTQTLSSVSAASFVTGQAMTLVDVDGNSQVFVVDTTVSTQDGSKDGSGRVIVGTSDVGDIESDDTDLAQKLVAVINASRSNGDHNIVASTPAADSAQITLTQGPGAAGNVDITSTIHGYTSFSFSGGVTPHASVPLRMVIPGLSSLRTNP